MINKEWPSDSDLAEHYGVHRTTIWAWVRDNPEFPKPVKLSKKVTRWRGQSINAFDDARARGAA